MNRTTLPTLAAIAALAACTHDVSGAAQPAAPTTSDSAKDAATPDADTDDREPVAALADGHVSRNELDAATHDLQQSLTRLVALEIIDVGALISDKPTGAMNCYGPCEDDPVGQAWMQEQVIKTDRFHALVDTAQELVRTTKTTATWAEAQAAVKDLDALQLVEIKAIHRESPSCDVGSCPGDPTRAAVLVALAKSVRGK